jgi:hypothetical protein
MKNKKLLIIFLCFVLIFTSVFPLKQAFADIIIPIVVTFGVVGGVYWFLSKFLPKQLEWAQEKVVQGIAGILHFIVKGLHFLLWEFNNSILAKIIDGVAMLNPFKEEGNAKSPIKVLWDTLKNIAYIILVFSALAAGFEWLMGHEEVARRLIFNIILVVLIINFSFVLIKEAFNIVKAIEEGIAGEAEVTEKGKESTSSALSKIGTIISASLWQEDPIEVIVGKTSEITQQPKEEEINSKENDKASAGLTIKYLIEIVGYIFILVFDMIILIVLVVTLLLFVLRYIMITFLAGVSPIAIASVTFPEFRGIAGLNEVFSGFRVFNTWLNYLVNWLLVIPIFIILVLLGNILKENIFTQIQFIGGESDLAEFIILLVILTAWYIIALIIAKRMSKGAGKFAEGLATAALLGAGGFAARGLLGLTRPAVGSILTKTGDYLTEKVPASRWTAWMAKPGMWMKEKGKEMTQGAYENQARLAEAKMNLYRERLEKETDPNKIAGITNEISTLTQQFKSNPYVLEKVVSQIEKMPTKTFAKIANNKDTISPLLSPDLPEEATEKIANKIKSLPTQTQLDILKDKDLRETYLKAGQKIQTAFFESLSNIDSDKMIKTIGENSPDLIKQIQTDEELKTAINKATKGLLGAIERGITKEIADSLLNIGESALKNYSNIQSIARQIKPEANLGASLQEALKIDPLPILKAAAKSTDLTLTNSLKQAYPDRQSIISALNAKEGTDLYRLINQIWSPIVIAK